MAGVNLPDEIMLEHTVPQLKPKAFNSILEDFGDLGPRRFDLDSNGMDDIVDVANDNSGVDSIGDTGNNSTWLRYAPAIGSGLQALSDALWLTNKNDYSNADMFQRSINSIPTVNYLPIGNYMSYTPFDETYQQNQLRSANNAARRAAMNNSSGNASAALAALNSLNANENDALGELGIRTAMYNNQMDQKVAEHNMSAGQAQGDIRLQVAVLQEERQRPRRAEERIGRPRALRRAEAGLPGPRARPDAPGGGMVRLLQLLQAHEDDRVKDEEGRRQGLCAQIPGRRPEDAIPEGSRVGRAHRGRGRGAYGAIQAPQRHPALPAGRPQAETHPQTAGSLARPAAQTTECPVFDEQKKQPSAIGCTSYLTNREGWLTCLLGQRCSGAVAVFGFSGTGCRA